MAALSIAPWPTSSNTEGLKPPDLPPPASIVSRHSWGEGVTDVCLDSGLRIILKPTDFLDDDIQFSAFAWTGISQAPQERLMHGRLARSVADELGWAGVAANELDRSALGGGRRGGRGRGVPSALLGGHFVSVLAFVCGARPRLVSVSPAI